MLMIRPANVNDVGVLVTMIRELAAFERELDLVVISEADLVRDGFGASPKFRTLIAEWDGEIAGYALFFVIYSTWEGRPGLFLEDVFVREQFRGKGLGKALFARVAEIACAENYYGIRWEVLDWNQRAIEFYQSLGVTFLDKWRSVLLSDEPLQRLAGRAG